MEAESAASCGTEVPTRFWQIHDESLRGRISEEVRELS
jgi:hypothetical protein